MLSLTKQQWFNAAWERAGIPVKALSQDGSCIYHALEDGTPGCFIGVVLADYDLLDIEGVKSNQTVTQLVEFNHLSVSDIPEEGDQMDFLDYLQCVHDMSDPSEWKTNLREIASEYKLTVPD